MNVDMTDDTSIAFDRLMREWDIALVERRSQHEILSNSLPIAVPAASAVVGGKQL